MTGIFNFFGSILGYLLWWLYCLFANYGVAILLFTILVKLIMFPFTLKQQKSMAAQSKLTSKQAELQKKYGNDRQKYSEELQKLYDKEGVSPTSGCLTSLIPFPILLGVFYSVTSPLSNTLHVAKDAIAHAVDYVSRLPGIVSTGAYAELEVIKNFSVLKNQMTFSDADIKNIEFFSKGFTIGDINLLVSPSENPFSLLIIIPIMSLVFQLLTQFYMQKTNQNGAQAQQGQGCMKVMMYALPLLGVWWSYTMPSAVGLYWGFSGLVSFIQAVLTNMFFSKNHLIAKGEAQRAVTLELAEANLRPLSASDQAEIARRIEASARVAQAKEEKKPAVNKKKKKK